MLAESLCRFKRISLRQSMSAERHKRGPVRTEASSLELEKDNDDKTQSWMLEVGKSSTGYADFAYWQKK